MAVFRRKMIGWVEAGIGASLLLSLLVLLMGAHVFGSNSFFYHKLRSTAQETTTADLRTQTPATVLTVR